MWAHSARYAISLPRRGRTATSDEPCQPGRVTGTVEQEITIQTRGARMDAIKMLKEDHRTVKALFREYEAAGDRAYQKKQRIAGQVFTELEVHSKLEEEIF